MASPFGLFNINKPPGLTSRKVVDRVAKLVRPAKAGHAGTLDPLATGVLIVCVGPATRLISYVQQQSKVYEARFLLGRCSDTDDTEGQIVETGAEPVPRERIEAELPAFVGRIEQVPPRFSAVHVAGRRAYDLARRGETVELTARPVDVYGIEVLSYGWPELALRIECGSGTYIRSIGRDLGNRLGCGAVMSALVRTRIGDFRLHEATSFDALEPDTWTSALRPATSAVGQLPRASVGLTEWIELGHGRSIDDPRLPEDRAVAAGDIAMVGPHGELVAIAETRENSPRLIPKHVFVRPDSPPAHA